MTSDTGGITPSSNAPKDDIPKQFQTGMSKPYNVKGDTAIRNWAKHFFPGMTNDQLDRFVQQFLMRICQNISREIGKEMKKQHKLAEKLKRAAKGEE